MNLKLYLEEIKKMNWIQPDFIEEIEEFKRIAKEENLELERLETNYQKGKATTLTEQLWQKLENTDSYDIESEAQFKKLSKKYGKNIDSLEDATELPMPIVVNINNRYYLIAGNTRLMFSRLYNIKPKIWLFNY